MNIKNIKYLVLLVLIGLQSASVHSMKRNREEDIPTLEELAQRAIERTRKKNVEMKVQAQIEEEVARVPQKFRVQLVKAYFDTIETLEDLKNDDKMPIYLELVPEFKVSYNDLVSKFGNDFTQYIALGNDIVSKGDLGLVLQNLQDFPLLIDLVNFSTVLESVRESYLPHKQILHAIRIRGNITEELLKKLFQILYGSFQKISGLQILSTNLRFIPYEIANFKNLKILSIQNNQILELLPDVIGSLNNLQLLGITRNPLLAEISDLVIPENLKTLEITEATRGLFSEKIQSYFYKERRPYRNNPNIIQIMLVRENEPLSYQTFYDRFYPTTFNEHVTFTQGQYPYAYETEKPSLVGGRVMSNFGYKLDLRNLANVVNQSVLFDTKIEVGGVTHGTGAVIGTPIVDLVVSGNILTEQLKSLFERNKNLWFVNISNSPIEFLPEELGNLENLKELTIVNCPNLQALPDSFENLLYQGVLDGIFFDEHVYSLVPERLKRYMPFKRQNGLLKIMSINPLTVVQERIIEDELEAIKREVNEEFSQLSVDLQRDIIQRYMQGVLDDILENNPTLRFSNQYNRDNAEDKNLDFNFDDELLQKISDKIRKDLVFQVYLEKIVELNLNKEINQQRFVEITYDFVRIYGDTYRAYDIFIDTEENVEVVLQNYNAFLHTLFNLNNNIIENEYVIFKPIIDTSKAIGKDVYLTFINSGSCFLGEYLNNYLQFMSTFDEQFLNKVKGIGIVHMCLTGFPTELAIFKKIEKLKFWNAWMSDYKLPEEIALFEELKTIEWEFEDEEDLNMIRQFKDLIPDVVFSMPNLEKIYIPEEVFQTLSDTFKKKFLKIDPGYYHTNYTLILKDQ